MPPIGQLVVAVHLWSLSELESGVEVHGQTLTLGFVLHTQSQCSFVFLTAFSS